MRAPEEEKTEGATAQGIIADAVKLLELFNPIPHSKVLGKLLEQIEKIDFREMAGLKEENEKLRRKHFLICAVERVLEVALSNNWGICKNHHFVYLYNGAYWNLFNNEELQSFLGKAAEKMGVDKFDARHFSFREHLYKQFLVAAHLPKPEQSDVVVFINLKNGTFEIGPDKQVLRSPRREDFLTYQLPFGYNASAVAPLFNNYLNTVLPEREKQMILAEYIAYLFIKPTILKLEKTLLLYGTGANGKSVFFEVINALLGGTENVSSYSLQSLTNDTGYFRAMLANKLVNYASEINGKLQASIFKQLVSGEPVEARLPYGEPFTLTNYAKLIFNCNELPRDVEQTNAYFRRFLIIPFDVTIPDAEQDKELSKKIISQELSGVFNWVLAGLKRLLAQKNFTYCESVNKQIENYKRQSDNVQMFIDDEVFVKSVSDTMTLKELYPKYRAYCVNSGCHPCSIRTFGERLRNIDFTLERKNYGTIVYIKKESNF